MNRKEVTIWQRQHIGTKPNGDIKWGDQCDTCGLTSWGIKRLQSNGFKHTPCLKCPDSIRKLASQ